MPSVVLQIGGRIRAERARRGISLRSLARSVGLSPSLISQIETGKCQPSVSTLYAITTALGVSVQDVFGESRPAGGPTASGQAAATSSAPGPAAAGPAVPAEPEPEPELGPGPAADGRAAGRRPGQGAASGPPGAADRLSGPGGPVACPGQREVLELDSGVTWERLGHAPGSQVDFLLVSYPPGGCSSPVGHLMQHSGTEYGYLLQGELVVTLGSRSHRLTPGDSVSFTSATPHSYRNEGPAPAVGVWFVSSDGA